MSDATLWRADKEYLDLLAMNRATRMVVGCFSETEIRWSLRVVAELCNPYLDAVCHTDSLSAYKGVVFGALHVIGGTQHIERFNATLRLRIAHLVRKSLSLAANKSFLNS
jgi:insertion element IS1 protein InsB